MRPMTRAMPQASRELPHTRPQAPDSRSCPRRHACRRTHTAGPATRAHAMTCRRLDSLSCHLDRLGWTRLDSVGLTAMSPPPTGRRTSHLPARACSALPRPVSRGPCFMGLAWRLRGEGRWDGEGGGGVGWREARIRIQGIMRGHGCGHGARAVGEVERGDGKEWPAAQASGVGGLWAGINGLTGGGRRGRLGRAAGCGVGGWPGTRAGTCDLGRGRALAGCACHAGMVAGRLRAPAGRAKRREAGCWASWRAWRGAGTVRAGLRGIGGRSWEAAMGAVNRFRDLLSARFPGEMGRLPLGCCRGGGAEYYNGAAPIGARWRLRT